MNMEILILYLVTFLAFIVVDLIWLGFVARKLYKKYLGFIMADRPNWAAALVFYLIFIFGLVYFVLQPNVAADSVVPSLTNGLLFGFITYATYDLTNLATLKNWPIKITLIDLCWGSALGGSVSLISYFVYNLLI
jgi:uncharacterized membrane protein